MKKPERITKEDWEAIDKWLDAQLDEVVDEFVDTFLGSVQQVDKVKGEQDERDS